MSSVITAFIYMWIGACLVLFIWFGLDKAKEMRDQNDEIYQEALEDELKDIRGIRFTKTRKEYYGEKS